MSKESWLDPIRYKDVVKLVKKRCPKAQDITVVELFDENQNKRIIANYKHEWNDNVYNLKMDLQEFGEFVSLDPRGGEDFFKLARKKNEGRIINNETFEQAYIRAYTEAIVNQREEQIKEAKKEKIFEDRFNKIYKAEKLYCELISKVADFIDRQAIDIVDEIEPNC